MNGKSLELGAGGGLVGLAVALGCHVGAPIYITDQEDMLDLMKQNVALNELESRVVPMVLNWLVPVFIVFNTFLILSGAILSQQWWFPHRQRTC